MAAPLATGGRPLSVLSHDSSHGRWELVSRAPGPWLAPHVRRLAGYVEFTTQSVRRREMPSESVVWIVNLGPRYRVIDARDGSVAAEHRSFVAGLHDSPTIVDSRGAACCLQVDFTPIGAYRFFGVPMHQLARVTTEGADLQGASAQRLLERLYETPGWSGRFDLLEDFVARRIEAARAPSAGVVWAWRRLEESRGRAGVRALAQELGWSRVHLARRFREQIGLPPKTVAQVLRFGRVLELLSDDRRGTLAELALACGYADQAHMNRDFRRFSGCSPSEYLRRQVPNGGVIDS